MTRRADYARVPRGTIQGKMLSEGRRRQLRVLLAIALDACTIVSALSPAYLLRFSRAIIPATDSLPAGPFFAILPGLIPFWIAVFAAHGLYRERLQGFSARRCASPVTCPSA